MNNKYPYLNIGNKIKHIRIDRGMTQQQVAAFIPMNQANYSKIERGVQELNLLQLKRLALLFNISTDSLLDVRLENCDDETYELEDFRRSLRKDLDDLFERYFRTCDKLKKK